ncbi:hypothetical protein KJ836_02625 [Patescibacteria group bacterium]|nr:hypothetical protein [Patescibacteria group bacterium]
MNYKTIGLNDKLRSDKGVAGSANDWQSSIYQDTHREQSPYTPPVQINKGTMTVTAGGIVDFQNAEGSTIFTYNASSGAIAITSNVEITGNFLVNGTSSTGTVSGTAGSFTSLNATNGTITNLKATTGTVSSYFTIGEILMNSNSSNKIREYFGLGLALADSGGANAVRIQNSNLTDLIQMSSKGGITFVPQGLPASPDTGQVVYYNNDNKLKVWNGSAWETISSST